MKNDGGPAFPTEPNTQPGFYQHHGMSLRDWFAGQVAGAIMAKMEGRADDPSEVWSLVAEYSYAIADAMLAERAKP